MQSAIDVSIVVPCYKSSATLPDLVQRVKAVLSARGSIFEIILINDASPDNTWQTIVKLASDEPTVHGYDMLANVGQFRATLTGLTKAVGNIVITMDDDLQHPPEELPKLLDHLRDHPELDVVIGAYRSKKHSTLRRLGTEWYARLANRLYGKPTKLEMTSFRAMRQSVARVLPTHPWAKPFLEILLLRTTKRIANVVVEHHPRVSGASGYNLRKLSRMVFDNLLITGGLPFTLIGLIGLVCVLIGILMLGWVLLGWLLGYTFGGRGLLLVILSSIAEIGGIGLITLAMIGELAQRMLHEMTAPPNHIIRAQTDSGERS